MFSILRCPLFVRFLLLVLYNLTSFTYFLLSFFPFCVFFCPSVLSIVPFTTIFYNIVPFFRYFGVFTPFLFSSTFFFSVVPPFSDFLLSFQHFDLYFCLSNLSIIVPFIPAFCLTVYWPSFPSRFQFLSILLNFSSPSLAFQTLCSPLFDQNL